MRIVITAGASGGHTYPALALARAIKTELPAAEVCMFFPKKLFFPWRPEEFNGLRTFFFSGIGLNIKKPWQYPYVIVENIRLVKEIFQTLDELRPVVIVSFGTFLTVAAAWWAHRKKVPIIAHEQNVLMGRGNAWALRWVNGLAFGMPPNILPRKIPSHIEVRFSGQLLRDGFLENTRLKFEGADGDFRKGRFSVLVVGGSQGSLRLNGLVLRTLAHMDRDERSRFFFVHIAGPGNKAATETFYRKEGFDAEVCDFSTDMPSEYLKADTVISRAGAGTIAESAAFGLPVILVPFPSKHQRENAFHLGRLQAALSIEDRPGAELILLNMLRHLCSDRAFRQELGRRMYKAVPTTGTEKLKEWVLEIVSKLDSCCSERLTVLST